MNMNINDNKNLNEPIYTISVVAKMLNIHPQTLRQYEKEQLIKPERSEGKIRLYSQQNVNQIKDILNLTRTCGVNIAGVYIILRLKEQIANLENKLAQSEKAFNELNKAGLIAKDKQLAIIKEKYLMVQDQDQSK